MGSAEARNQWRQIIQRGPQPRQERYLPVEVLLCYGLFFVLDPHGFGGGNINLVPEVIVQLASTLKRSPGSLTSKMLNLDGSRHNCARAEPELFLFFSSHPDEYLHLYRNCVQSARAVGLGPSSVPDFLELAESGDLELIGQDELGAKELAVGLSEQSAWIDESAKRFDFELQETERLAEQKIRLGQHRFARSVLANYGYSCVFCGFSPKSLRGSKLLVASHIKPWRACNSRERLDPRNGIAACPTHDRAFDTGLLGINGGLKIHRAGSLEASLRGDEGTALYFGSPVLRERILIDEGRAPPSSGYLDYHRKHIFKSNR